MINVAGNFQTNSSQALRAAILSGLGIGFAPELLIGDDLKRGALSRSPLGAALRNRSTPSCRLIAGVPRRRVRSWNICELSCAHAEPSCQLALPPKARNGKTDARVSILPRPAFSSSPLRINALIVPSRVCGHRIRPKCEGPRAGRGHRKRSVADAFVVG
jgi:hypothetical protein